MRFKIEQRELMKGMGIIQKAVQTNSAMAIHKGILISAENNSVQLIAANQQLEVQTELEARVSKAGSIVLDAGFLGAVVRNVRDQCLEISVEDNFSVEIKGVDLQMILVGLDPQNFLHSPEILEANSVVLKGSILSQMIKQTAFAVSKAEHFQAITGVLMEVDGDEMILAATDGYRFALSKQHLKNRFNGKIKIIIPGSSLAEVGKLLNNDPSIEVKISLSDQYASFLINKTMVFTKLLQGDFVNYQGIMPIHYESKVQVKTRNLLEALEIISVFAQRNHTGVKFNITNEKIKIFANGNIGNILKQVGIELEGLPINEIAFNVTYLIEGLKAIEEEQVKLCFLKGSNSPMVIRPVSNVQYEYLVLPIRIQRY